MGISNIGSFVRAMDAAGADVRITNDPSLVKTSQILALPGVGAFGAASEALTRLELKPAICEAVQNGAWLLGVCLGMQLLLEDSDEFGAYSGLGLISGKAKRLPVGAAPYQVPNIGWRYVDWKSKNSFVPAGPDRPTYYFAHSYHVLVENPDCVIGTMQFGAEQVAAAIRLNRVVGVQFHPEKSQSHGAHFLAEFIRLSRG